MQWIVLPNGKACELTGAFIEVATQDIRITTNSGLEVMVYGSSFIKLAEQNHTNAQKVMDRDNLGQLLLDEIMKRATINYNGVILSKDIAIAVYTSCLRGLEETEELHTGKTSAWGPGPDYDLVDFP